MQERMCSQETGLSPNDALLVSYMTSQSTPSYARRADLLRRRSSTTSVSQASEKDQSANRQEIKASGRDSLALEYLRPPALCGRLLTRIPRRL